MGKRGPKPGSILGPRKKDNPLRRYWRLKKREYVAKKRREEARKKRKRKKRRRRSR